MKKSNVDIQSENTILLALAIADSYLPLSQKEYKDLFKKRMELSGTKSYKESCKFALGGMPNYSNENAVICGRLTLVGKDNDYLDIMLGNNEQIVDDYNNVAVSLVDKFNSNNNITNIYSNMVVKNKQSLYHYLDTIVLPKLVSDRLELLSNPESQSTLSYIRDKNLVDTLFEYKFDAFRHYTYCHTKTDERYYALVHGEFDAVIDMYDSLLHAYDREDVDTRSICPNTIDFDRDNRR